MAKKLLLTLTVIVCSIIVKATNYYSDPSIGLMTNNGSFATPWANLQAIASANKIFNAGDTIFLRNGNHGFPNIKGVNTGNVVIMPQTSHTPVINQIVFGNGSAGSATSSYWKLYKLFIQSEGLVYPNSDYLVNLTAQADHITVSTCTITSNLNTSSWSRNDWRSKCRTGVFTRSRLNAFHVIENNTIINVSFGLSIGSSNTMVKNNTVKYFITDGSRVLGSDILFEGNRITDGVNALAYYENHDDLFQGFTSANPGSDTLKNVIVRKNIFINCTDSATIPLGNREPTQGIGCFDGVFKNWLIENNIIIADSWHGLSLYGAQTCTIINNTVIDPYKYSFIDPYDSTSTLTSVGPTWILISQKTGGPPSFSNIIKNNLVNTISIASTTIATTITNYTIAGVSANYNTLFVYAPNIGNYTTAFDLHLKNGSAAIDFGTNAGSPLTDFDGVARPQGIRVDAGAYEFIMPTSLENISNINSEITLYPNPSDGIIKINTTPNQYTNYIILNVLGEEVLSGPIYQSNFELTIEKFPSGIYYFRFDNKKESKTIKFVKN